MRIPAAGVGERRPQRSRPDDPAGSFRRGELAAGLATAALFAHLLFAQITLLLVVALVAIGCGSRWRPQWLLLPALASLCWLLAVGIDSAATSFVTGSQRLASFLIGAAVHPARLAHLSVPLAGTGAWLPRELPLAILAATGESAAVLWLCWWRRSPGRRGGWQWRPGLCAVLRRRISATAIAAGHTVTSDGCAVGVDASTGKLAGFSWAEAGQGVLLTGRDRQQLDQLGLAATCAALRRRKTVLIVDLGAAGMAGAAASAAGVEGLAGAAAGAAGAAGIADGAAGVAGVAGVVVTVAGLARSLGVPAAEIVVPGPGQPGRTASVRRVGASAGLRPEVTATGMVARASAGPEVGARGMDAGVSAGPEVAATGLAADASPAVTGIGGAIGRAVRGRGAVLISARHPGAARQVIDDLTGVLASLRDLGLRGDTLAWLTGCEALDRDCLTELVSLGPETGTAILLSMTSATRAAQVAPAIGTIVAAGPLADNLATQLAAIHGDVCREFGSADTLMESLPTSQQTRATDQAGGRRPDFAIGHILRTQQPGAFTMLSRLQLRDGQPRGQLRCRMVPIALGDVR